MMTTWITTPEDLAALVHRARLTPVLVRYRGATEGRFTAPAQDVADLVAMLEATGRYARDLSTTEEG
mgnify:CR=1 FL=1